MLEALKNVILFVPYAIITLILLLFIAATFIFAWLTGSILDIAISPTLISLSYTNPEGNQIIKSGLSITQSFVNLILVVALVYAALSIALRMNETEAKKMLARLIVVALLVNFVPVFLGLIVDAANIVMYYFLDPIKDGASGALLQIGTFFDMVKNTIWQARVDITNRLGVIMMGITQIAVNIGIAVAFFLFAGIFLVRYIAIWILVILAPIAFVAWIFPGGKVRAFWDMWFNQFIQWSIIGIPLAFFLYLAMGSFSLMTAAFKAKIEMPGIEPMASGYFNQVFPYFVIIGFLYFGFIIGLKTGAMGASAAISYTTKIGQRGAKFAGRLGKSGMRKALGRRGREFLEKQAAARFMPQKIAEMKGIKGLLAKTAYTLTLGAPVGSIWALRRGIGEASLRILEAERKEIRSAEEKAKGTTAERKASVITSAIAPIEAKIGYLKQAIEEKQIGDLRKAGLVRDSDIIKLAQEALVTHPEEFAKIRDAFPHLAEQIGKGFSEEVKREAGLTFKDNAEEDQFNKSIAAKIVARMSSSRIPQMDWESAFNDPLVEEAVHRFWNPEQLSTALKNFGSNFAQRFQSRAQALGRTWYQTNNPLLARYLESDAANSLGIGFEKEKPVEEKKIIPPSEEEFRKARKKYGPGTFG